MSDSALCILGARPHRAEPGLLLCAAHLDRLGTLLRDIEDEAIHLDARPSMAVRYDHGGGGLASERSPARLEVIALRDHRTKLWTRDGHSAYQPVQPKSTGPWCLMCDHDSCTAWRAGRRRDLHDDEHDAGSNELLNTLGALHGWARVVREERGLAAPERVTITGERDLLTRHLAWIGSQAWVDEFDAEIRKLAAVLKQANGTQPDRPVGRCYLPADEGTCNGPVWVDDAAGRAHCGTCRSTWDGPQLALLKHALDQARLEAARPRTADGRRMLTAAELVAAGIVSTVSNVRVIAHRLGSPAVNGHYDPAMFDTGSRVARVIDSVV